MDHPFPNLRIVPIQSLHLQVKDDVQNVGAIMECLTTECVIRDPPVVATIDSSGLKYMVLDGADCVIALRKMNVPHILGQVVEPGNSTTPRALRVNYPLTELMDGKTLIEKNNALQRWLQARIVNMGVRCYEEATFLFDE